VSASHERASDADRLIFLGGLEDEGRAHSLGFQLKEGIRDLRSDDRGHFPADRLGSEDEVQTVVFVEPQFGDQQGDRGTKTCLGVVEIVGNGNLKAQLRERRMK